MKRMVIFAAMICAAVLSANAQTEEEDWLKKVKEKVEIADSHPNDGKKQLDASYALIYDELGDKRDFQRSLKYADRALEIAKAQEVLKDTLLGDAYMQQVLISIDLEDYAKAGNCWELALEAYEKELGKYDPITIGTKLLAGHFLLRFTSDPRRGCLLILESFFDNDMAPEDKRIENMEMGNIDLEYALEVLTAVYTNHMRYAVPMIYMDGKPYFLVQTQDWNIERPLVGWLQPTLLRNSQEEVDGDDPIVFNVETNEFRRFKEDDAERPQMTWNIRQSHENPRQLEIDEGSSALYFLSEEQHDTILNLFREFKASGK